MRSTLLSTLIAACVLAAAAPDVQAQQPPLAGGAYRIAEDAYAAYARGDYRRALAQASEAVRLRPDVARLHLLRVNALQQLGRHGEAREAARRALDAGIDDPALRALARAPAAAPRRRAPGAAAGPVAVPVDATEARAFDLATRAYAAYNDDRMAEAAERAAEAFRLAPARGEWALLWIASLEAQARLSEAVDAVDAALALGAPNVADLRARRAVLGRQQAVGPAQDGYQALIAQRPDQAVPFAREAVALAPDVASHRLLLITALMLDGQLEAAEQAAAEALAQDEENTVALAMRAYVRQRQLKSAEANADFDAALGHDWLDDQQLRNLRLLAVDAALAAGDRQRAAQLLQPLKAAAGDGLPDAAAQALAGSVARREKALRSARPGETLTLAGYPAPVQVCRETPYGTQCELVPIDGQGEGGAAQQAYAAFGRQAYQEAIAQARRAVEQEPSNASYQQLLTTALAAGDRTQMAEAEQRLALALAAAPDDADLLMQRAYLFQRSGRPAEALRDFRAAQATGHAPPTVELDMAYAMAAGGERREAVSLLRGLIDRADAGGPALDPLQREAARNGVANLGREWGMTASVGHRGARQAATNLGGAAISTPGDAAFGTLEAFWRPPALNRHRGLTEAYARLAGTLYDEGGTFESILAVDPCTGEVRQDERTLAERRQRSRSTAGLPSSIASLGLRHSFGQSGISAGLERRQFVGSATRRGGIYPQSAEMRCRIQRDSDGPQQVGTLASYRLDDGAGGWMGYLTYGFYRGTGMRSDAARWWTVSGYAQAGYSRDDNRARFAIDRLDGEGRPDARLLDSSGRLRREQWFAAGELRVGRTFRPGTRPDWLVTPFAVLAADWSDQRSRVRGIDYPLIGAQSFALSDSDREWSLGAGPGIGVRRWFREDRHSAPRSYLDFSVQYRMSLGGGDSQRARGLFATATLSY